MAEIQSSVLTRVWLRVGKGDEDSPEKGVDA